MGLVLVLTAYALVIPAIWIVALIDIKWGAGKKMLLSQGLNTLWGLRKQGRFHLLPCFIFKMITTTRLEEQIEIQERLIHFYKRNSMFDSAMEAMKKQQEYKKEYEARAGIPYVRSEND